VRHDRLAKSDNPFAAAPQSVWRGDELRRRSDWLVELQGSEVDELIRAERSVSEMPLEAITPRQFALPTLAGRLREIQRTLEEESGATWIRNFPLSQQSDAQATRMFWGMMQHLGTPLSQSAAGEKIFHVRDEGFGLNDPRSRGPNTKKKLSFHTDRCDVIAFLCLRQARQGGENSLVSSPALYLQILQERPDLLDVLRRPYHYQRHNVDLGNDKPYCRQPVFSFREGFFAGSFLRVLIERAYQSTDVPPMTDPQREALDFLEEVAERPEMQVRLRQEPGDILLLNNWVTFHRRDEFEDHEDPNLKRHLLRVWLAVPNSRPLDPLFRENYGDTAAGAIRGGMRAAGGA
jgi:alpha-ketoglutarate-dependent taurine dioxygenase